MIAILSAAALAVTPASEAGSDTEVPRGRCRYTQAVIDKSEGAVLVTCDKLDIARGEQEAVFDFSQKSWGSMLKFHGEMSGDRMKVSRITLRNGKSADADGTCQVFHNGDRLAVISCLAMSRGQTYVANFVPTRF